MIRLGHIDYSNCIPVHALLLDATPPDVHLVRDVPARLNAALAAGDIDVAPCSSIEYARHAADYAILPAHAIGSFGPVHSILLESTTALPQLDGAQIAVPTASATSVVLLRILLELRLGVRPRLVWYEQAAAADPIAQGAAAALRIGDVALRRTPSPGRHVHDLGAEWTAWTGLPMAFAVWQVRRDLPAADVARITRLLHESRAWYNMHAERIAQSWAPHYGLTAPRLMSYWNSLRFELDAPMRRGLLRFYALAAELGVVPAVTRLELTADDDG